MTRRTDRALETAWRMTLAMMTFAAGVLAVALLYFAFFAGIDARWAPMGVLLVGGAGMAWSTWWLCNNRSDLVGTA